MRTWELMQIDAFTDQPLRGNPCAVVFDADDLDGAAMQAIAREMNLSETAFVMASEEADFRVRYFTPGEEIPMAGHPTIATSFALADTGRFTLRAATTRLLLSMPAGVIPVDLDALDGQLHKITMTQLAPTFGQTWDAETVLPAFGLEPGCALEGAPIQTVSTGTPQLMVPLRRREDLERARLDIPRYRALREQADFFSPHLFCLQGYTDRGATAARHFGVPPDLVEDPFTGSATGGMAAFLWHHGLIDEPRFCAEQGHTMGRPGWADVEVLGPPEAIEGVKVGGRAIAVFRGELMLP